jgi:hypothetical protein
MKAVQKIANSAISIHCRWVNCMKPSGSALRVRPRKSHAAASLSTGCAVAAFAKFPLAPPANLIGFLL